MKNTCGSLFGTWILFLGSAQCLANSFEWIPLKALPTPEEIVAFSNRPANGRDQWVSPEQIRALLKTGKLHSEPPTKEQMSLEGERLYANGVFVSQRGMAYYCSMWNRRFLHIVNSEGRRCVIEAAGKGISVVEDEAGADQDVYRKLAPPTAHDVNWFFNDPGPATGGSVRLEQDVVMRFLREGRPVPCTSVVEEVELRKNTWLTLPPKLAKVLREMQQNMNGDAIPRNFEDQAAFQVTGVLVTEDRRILFWNQWSDRLLAMRDESGGICVLRLP
jgi:hypothetical protein